MREPEAGSGFKVILSYRAFEAALSYLTPDFKKKQKLREMRGERGETSVRVEGERRKRKPERLEEVGRGKRRRGHPECALGSCVCVCVRAGGWGGGELGLSFLRGASLLQSSQFLIHYRKQRFRAPRHRTRLLPSFLRSCQDAPAVKAQKGKRGRGGRGTRAWEEGREDCAMPLRQDFLTVGSVPPCLDRCSDQVGGGMALGRGAPLDGWRPQAIPRNPYPPQGLVWWVKEACSS